MSKSHPSARNRFIYYNGKLNKAPNSLVSAITQSIDKHSPFHGLLGRVLKEPFQPVSQDVDESLHDFISRRFGTAFAEKVMSALIHGIYAGDTRKLSVAAVFPSMWRMEKLRGSIVKSLLLGGLPVDPAEAKDRAGLMTKLGDLAKSMRKVSVYTLDGGLQLLPDTLEKALRRESSVEIRQGAELQAVTKTHDGISLRIEDKDVSVNRMVSAISSSGLQKLLPYDELSHNPSVTVGVVNLAFTADYRLPVTGFGYLIPRSVDPTQNPHQALGVVFDSDMFDSPGQPTRLTVMLGGHYWDGRTSVPSEDELLEAALDTLVRHGIIPSGLAPVASRVSIQRDCIPQYAIGHVQRMRRLHTRLRDDFDGRLAVVGSSYSGVGVNDCVRSSWNVARRIAQNQSCTGLEQYASV